MKLETKITREARPWLSGKNEDIHRKEQKFSNSTEQEAEKYIKQPSKIKQTTNNSR